jgi:hypothetical protein
VACAVAASLYEEELQKGERKGGVGPRNSLSLSLRVLTARGTYSMHTPWALHTVLRGTHLVLAGHAHVTPRVLYTVLGTRAARTDTNTVLLHGTTPPTVCPVGVRGRRLRRTGNSAQRLCIGSRGAGRVRVEVDKYYR